MSFTVEASFPIPILRTTKRWRPSGAHSPERKPRWRSTWTSPSKREYSMRCPSALVFAASIGILSAQQQVGTTTLSRPTLNAFTEYVQKAEARLDAQVHGSKFLWA